MKLHRLTIQEIHNLISKGDIQISDLVDKTFQRIDEVDSSLGAFVNLRNRNTIDEIVQEQWEKAKGYKNKEEGSINSLWGIPFGVQDNICVKATATTCGSKILKEYISPYDAYSIDKLKEKGAMFIGKLNMDEFSMGFSTENSAFRPTLNPWDRTKVSGGAGGGCAAAVASNQILYAIGSDGAGCLRQPASFCGVVGLKPTYGLVSRYGLVTTAPSLEQIGIVSKDVIDCSTILKDIASYDKKDSTSRKRSFTDYTDISDKRDLKGIRIGIPEEIFSEKWDPYVKRAIEKAQDALRALGAEFINISIPHFKYVGEAHFIIMCSEAVGSLSRYDGLRYGYTEKRVKDLESLYKKVRTKGFGQEVKARLMLGNLFLGTRFFDTHYRAAQRLRDFIKEDFKKAYNKCDIIMTPTCPNTAYGLQEKGYKRMGMDKSHDYTLMANLTGLPAITIPCGFDQNNLPIGMQLMGGAFKEKSILGCAYVFEKNTDYHKAKPEELEVGL